MLCPRKHNYAAMSFRRAVLAMIDDRFSPEEIALGLEVELSAVLPYVRERAQQARIAELM